VEDERDQPHIAALRFRYLVPPASKQKYTSRSNSHPLLCGAHLVNQHAYTLIIVEGELNGASIWQACADAGLDATVVSIGSQSVSSYQLEAIEALSGTFARTLVWADEEQNALDVWTHVRSRYRLPITSPRAKDGTKLDASDLLVRDELAAFLDRKLHRPMFYPTNATPRSRVHAQSAKAGHAWRQYEQQQRDKERAGP
jgi:hypothetical protein